MRNIILIFWGLTVSLNLSAQANRRIVHLSGAISDKYPITMILTFNDEQVLGYYFYKKYQSKILLEGHIQGDAITLNENPDYNSDFRIGFLGNLKDGSFSGVWTDKIKNRALNFKTTIDSDNLISVPGMIADIQGTYENIHNSDEFFSSVDLQHITEDLFCFEISTGTESGCVGHVKGMIQLVNWNKGEYSVETCEKLSIALTSDELTVIESNCDLHGMRCSFDGKYVKK